MLRPRPARPFAASLLALLLAAGAQAQAPRVTAPEQQFGHPIGADYVLPNYQRMLAYWQKLDAESERMQLVEIGRTAEGRTQVMAVVSAPGNLRRLEHYRQLSERLARAELPEAEARRLAAEGRAVVWIDGGLHATEVLGAQQLMETVYQLVSRDDAETRRILDDVIVLAVHANPDGHDLVADWYMREPDAKKRSISTIPRLYQKYIGHDNNRDSYASTQPETENMNRVLYRQWYPQVMYNHHQTGPTGTVMFAPPFRDPFNYVFDPLVVAGIELVGAAMQGRFIAEQKPGVTQRRGANYSTWWNGGLRTTVYFHNMIGLLTETIGNPTPMHIPFVANRQVASTDLPFPIRPQPWHFRQSVDYSVTANYAVLDVVSRHREQFLFNIWQMGRNSIERGGRDHWTHYPSRVDSVREVMRREREGATDGDGMAVGGLLRGAPDPEQSARYLALLRRPEWKDARGYVLSADQPDFATATKFVNALLETGIDVHRASAPFSVAGRTYPAGSYVVKTAQAFRPHVLDMFEPQDHPHDFRYEGGPPIPPYDNAGWTLALQMGVRYDRVLEGFDGPFEKLTAWNVAPPAGRVTGTERAAGFVLDPRQNDAFRVLNRLHKAGLPVFRLPAPLAAGGTALPAGALYVPRQGPALAVLQQAAAELGVDVHGVAARPAGALPRVRPVRIGLWDRYGGSMPSGWIRWLLEQWEYPYQLVFAQRLDHGELRKSFDVLIFPDGAVPERDRAEASGGYGFAQQPKPEEVPAEFRPWLGQVTVAKTVPQLRRFLEQGGTVLTIGSSTILGEHLGLPVSSALVETTPEGKTEPLPASKFYIPGSILQVRVDTTRTVAAGLPERVDVFFDSSPVFRLGEDAAARGVRPVAWFESERPLRSGWAWGERHLLGGVAVAEAEVGRGTLFLFGPEITFRAQPHGTFKFLFNALALAGER